MEQIPLFIGGVWRNTHPTESIPVINPATEDQIGLIAKASLADIEDAAIAAEKGFAAWKQVSALERATIMHKAANLIRERAENIALILTTEHGKPLAEAMGEVAATADTIDWHAEEGRRAYGRVIPSRALGIHQFTLMEPIGPVVGFAPWNFPLIQAVKKVAGALAAGCSIILKGATEAPTCAVELVKAFADAGVSPGAVNLLFGDSSQISEYLIAHPSIRKVTFTGSTPVGKKLASLAGLHMKRSTMELGGHAPVIVMDDADIATAVKISVAAKYRNAGQVCVSPTRFLVHYKVFDEFVSRFVEGARAIKVGDGLDPTVTMGPMAHLGRLKATEELVADAVSHGAKLEIGGNRVGDKGYFFEPTVLTNVPVTALAMVDEPFGPIAIINPFDNIDEAIKEANRLPYGLSAYAYTRSLTSANKLFNGIESGAISINHHSVALPEHPFGGVKDSGYGTEGGPGALDAFMTTKFVSLASVL
ncbi:NAD-dependent succinate-semialdehyde dehydrogenase [Pseudomonas carnis]|uniref:NAD-dependent succinate-semialdehyde dehydrogenase n=1 Tax=Pseudomonas TaxID=286 RepID=UPI000D3B599E|nr:MULTISPECIES: NAD-dependent succinate-semialdehyde dehydrogenase [unclassified Pseudomonas]MCR8662972.1 NAD-dependent succinate-semialdehyde dehydrogenase [Pseudomonas carnis]PTT14565.1 NAD-dependent succinate-semialdehyde dehydrogenase [Pseudomonas sp. HMWF034]PVV71515.1 NAD-dependent succinate-semialdehyde dehydrogenase [Pseudomonas sp. HMWF011]